MKKVFIFVALILCAILGFILWTSTSISQSTAFAKASCEKVTVGNDLQTLENIALEYRPDLITALSVAEKKHNEFEKFGDFKASALDMEAGRIKFVFKAAGATYSICAIDFVGTKISAKVIINSP